MRKRMKRRKRSGKPEKSQMERRVDRWTLLRRESQEAIDQETLILIANNIWMARNRGQDMAEPHVMVEKGWTAIRESLSAPKAFQAFNKAELQIEALGFTVDPVFCQIVSETGEKLTMLKATVTEIQEGDIQRLRNLHWATIGLKKARRAALCIPRLRKKT